MLKSFLGWASSWELKLSGGFCSRWFCSHFEKAF
jgi:hypothetical protein